MPEGQSADRFRRVVHETFDMSLGNGLSKVADRVFRIGHLGDFNDLMLAGTLSGVEMGLEVAGVPHKKGGAAAALAYRRRSRDRIDGRLRLSRPASARGAQRPFRPIPLLRGYLTLPQAL
jgi:hypothetical protein